MKFDIFSKFGCHVAAVIIISCELVSSQVTTDINELENEFFGRPKIYGRVPGPWFKPINMSEYAKFMLCVDVYQKLLGVNLMEEHFITENGTTALPKFEIDILKIINTHAGSVKSVIKRVIHCPLHKVQFSTLNYGEDFYISGSSSEFCVYLFSPTIGNSQKELTLAIKAKVCEVMINVRYNRLELDQELATIITQSGLSLVKWSQINALDNEIKFMTCIIVEEKLYRTQLYSQFYETDNHQNALPSFNIERKNLSLSNGVHEFIVDDFEVLYCPLNEIRYPQQQKMNPFYLAKSFYYDCVYKMVQVDESVDHIQQATVLRIKAEICGIFGNTNNNVDYLEQDLVDRLAISQDPNYNFLSWDDLNSISPISRFLMCTNAMKKVYVKNIIIDHDHAGRKSRRLTDTHTFKLKLDHRGMDNIPIRVFKCPMHNFTSHHLVDNPFYLTSSPRIGCVYKLSITRADNTLLKIDNLICGIYPPKYYLQLHSKFLTQPFI